MYTDRPTNGEPVDTGVDASPAPSTTSPTPATRLPAQPSEPAGGRGYLEPGSTTDRLRLLWSTGARDVTLVAPRDTPRPGGLDPRGWIAGS